MTLCCMGIGIAATRGIAIGEAHLLQRGSIDAAPRFIERSEVPAEIDRFRQAVSDARSQLFVVREKIPESTRSDIVAFIDAG